MPTGDWRKRSEIVAATCYGLLAIIGAVVLLYVLGVLNGREAERRDQAPASYSEAAKADAERACAGTKGATAFECIYERVEASQEQARGEQDLSAQQRAATSALASAVIALLTLAVTGVGVWFVKRTLDATLEAVKDTGEATEAMERQNELTAKAQRPWLKIMSPIDFNLFKLPPGMLTFEGIEGAIPVQNFGNSPALNCRAQLAIFSSKSGYNPDNIYGFMLAEHQTHSIAHAAVFPGENGVLTPPSYCPVHSPFDWTEIESVEIDYIELAIVLSYQSVSDPNTYHSADIFRISLQETYNFHACRVEATSGKFGTRIT